MSGRADGDRDSVPRFLDLVERDCQVRCAQLHSDAQRSAAELRKAARREARVHVARAAAEARASMQQRVHHVRAELAAEERATSHEIARTLLSRAWESIASELARRWESPEQRKQWVRRLIEDAARVLPKGQWLVEHPQLGPEELKEIAAETARASGAPPRLVCSEALVAGLRVSASGALVDGSVTGLLAMKTSVQGRLLLELRRRAGAGGVAP